MRELLQIVFGFLGVAAFVWLILKLQTFFENHFGLNLIRRPKNGKVEIQTLFHGNTKDRDQI